MRLRPIVWMVVSIACFLGAIYFWRLGNQWNPSKPAAVEPATNPAVPAVATAPQSNSAAAAPRLLSVPGNLNQPAIGASQDSKPPQHLAYRLSNTAKPLKELARNDRAILLENALLDTAENGALAIPDHLRAQTEPGAYIVQARGSIDTAFRQQLAAAGATIVSYIPNHAFLVRATSAVAQGLRGQSRVGAVVAYEPYFKLKPGLLNLAVDQKTLPDDAVLNVLLFADQKQATVADLQKAGAEIFAEEPSPFGTVVKIRPGAVNLSGLAAMPGVQIVELARERVQANDLSRVRLGISTNIITETNYLGLSGQGIIVNINDSGVDTNHPGLVGRVFGDLFDTNWLGGVDDNGHGTHVAGTIAGSGAQSETVTNAPGSKIPPEAAAPNQFRGMAPSALLYAIPTELERSPVSDYFLQNRAASTNTLVSNNSWHYRNNFSYDLAAASFDSAVRDSIPLLTGSQPMLYVFAAGNRGDGADNGQAGDSGTVMSPGTAKNVITVGAVEQVRDLTNDVMVCFDEFGTLVCVTNQPWETQTDFNNEVAAYSSRGNVGVGIEGDSGRFKPDVVAPGTAVISARSTTWDESAYYNFTNVDVNVLINQFVNTNELHTYSLWVPDNAIQVTIRAEGMGGLPMPIFVRNADLPTPALYDFLGTNVVRMPQDAPLPPLNSTFFYGIGSPTNGPVRYNLYTSVVLTNNNGNYSEVLSNLNAGLGPFYRFESGTSMAAGGVSGTLALMHEFFTRRMNRTNSPALMKALVVNGARPTGPVYDLHPGNTLNLQGWGTMNLTNSLPGGLSNLVANPLGPAPMLLVDQDPANALATGDSVTRTISVAPEAINQPLRVTLVWTDPPGNPSASLKLVNNLDLIVTNLSTGEVHFGNDIPTESNFNLIWDTNSVPNYDVINNVENVYLNYPLGTNYSVTVRARNVNVNAVTAHPDNIAQDYALVISSGNGAVEDALTVVQAPKVSVPTDNVVTPTNSFAGNDKYTGTMLMNQRVGANPALLGTNQVPLAGSNPTPWGGGGDGVLTLGISNQWRFYILTNENSFTNAAFITFLPPNLSVPRMGVNEFDITNASRIEADIDLYVSTDPRLLTLDPSALAGADKSLGRGGTEFVAYSNAVPLGVYYIAVKSEDQQAAEYAFVGIFSLDPFSTRDEEGNVVVHFFPVPSNIPDGSPVSPGGVPVLGLSVDQVPIRRAVVHNIIQHENMGDLVGNLSHSQISVILNNHRPSPPLPLQPGPWEFIYDDLGERKLPPSPTINAIPDFRMEPDGPGRLKDFIGEQGLGVWTFFVIDNALSQTGMVRDLKLVLEPQRTQDDIIAVEPGEWTFDFVDVPPDATNLTICVAGNTEPMELYVSRNGVPGRNPGEFEWFKLINPPGDCLSITPYDIPPLTPGRYYYGVFNPSTVTQNIRIIVTVERDPFAVRTTISSPTGPTTITDDAITYAYITNYSHLPVFGLDVGMLINHPRISDLAITLISPAGTRILLFEDRGGWNNLGLGSVGLGTNAAGETGILVTNLLNLYTNSFENSAHGIYSPGAFFEGWHVLSNYATVMPDYGDIARVNNILVPYASTVSNSLPTTSATAYTLSFKATHAPYLVGTVGWWPLDGNGQDIFGGLDGFYSGQLVPFTGKVGPGFFGNGVRSSVTVPASPALDVGPGRGFSLEGWVYPVNVDAQQPAPLIAWANPTNAASPGVQFWLMSDTNATATLRAEVWDTNGLPHTISTPALAVTNYGWQHVALTYDAASAEARIYVNGNPAAAQVIGAPGALVPQTTHDLYFGYLPGHTNVDLSFLGGLDEIGLYDRALSPAEVLSIMRADLNGKYSASVLTNPVAVQVTLLNATPSTFIITNGLAWTNGPVWEQNQIQFNTVTTNPTPILITALDPNVAIDDVILSGITTNLLSGFFHFTENTNQALLPIKYAPTPYAISNFPPTLFFTNDFEAITQGVFQAGAILPGSSNAAVGAHDWSVLTGPVTVVSNAAFGAGGNNWLVLSTNQIETTLPTAPGDRYQVTYTVRGPAAVGWWNGAVEPYSRRALDRIGGNHGAFIHPATNLEFAAVIPAALAFGEVSNVVGKVELGDPERLRLTNSFTIEAWIYPTNLNYGQILFRGDMRNCLDPYFFAMTGDRRLRFHVEDALYPAGGAAYPGCGVDAFTDPDLLALREWQHVAAVFETDVPYRGNASILTNELRIYHNGQPVITNYTGQRPFADLDPAYSPGVSIGNRSRSDISEPFRGYIDELTVYARALTDVELGAISEARPFGKFDTGAPAAQSLARVTVAVDNVLVDSARGDNATWTTRTFTFTANRSDSVLRFEGLLPGTIIDGVTLTHMPAEMRYLPEEELDSLNGEDAYGVWALEVWDTRAGASNVTAQIVNWQLTFVTLPNTPAPAVKLLHGMPYTNTLRANSIQNFIVQVPQWASFATNVLLFGTNTQINLPVDLGLLYDRTNFPGTVNNALLWPPVSQGSVVLDTNTATPQHIVPGMPYFLTVTNPNPYAATFALGVWYDIQPLTNCTPATNFVGPAGIPRYFQFDVPDETVLPGEPRNVSFWLAGVWSSIASRSENLPTNLTLVLSQSLPLPDLGDYDYISRWAATNGEIIMLVTNSTPFPITTNRWYVGVFNSAPTNVPFTIEACYATSAPTVISLTNGVEFAVDSPTNALAAPPGAPRRVFFEFEITNYTGAVLFELYGLSGNADLVLQRDTLPTMAPYFAASYREGLTPEQIVLRPNSALPDLRGRWYLGVYNNDATNVAYTIRAVLADTNGLLSSGQPIQSRVNPMPPPRGLRVSWNAIVGEAYIVEFSPTIINPVWTNVGPAIVATTPFPAIELPIQGIGSGFYRVSQVGRITVPVAPTALSLAPDGRIRIAWPLSYFGYTLRYSMDLVTWYDANLPITIEGPDWVAYDIPGPVPKFYRVSP